MPLPADWRHVKHNDNEVWPSHWNDVRFNFKPQNQDRRCYIHDNYMNAYDIYHDFAHTTGFVDEDMDWESPDPINAAHYKLKRSQVMHALGIPFLVGFFIFVPICGFKLPQIQNPFYWRKKYAGNTTIAQMQRVAMQEYGAGVPKPPCDSSAMISNKGFTHVGGGMRYNLPSYGDLVC